MKNISAEMTYASDGISFSAWIFYFIPDNNGKAFTSLYLNLLTLAANLSTKEKLAIFQPDKSLKSKPRREVAEMD